MSCVRTTGSNLAACAVSSSIRQARHFDQIRFGAAGAEDQQIAQMIDQRRDERVGAKGRR